MRFDPTDEERLRRLSSLAEEDPDEGDDEEEPTDREGPAKESVVTLDILRKHRTIIISETVTPKLTRQFMSQLLWLDGIAQDPVRVFINTPGGSADDGFAICDIIRFVTAPVFTICVGLNASAGTIALLGAPKERRFALPSARIMIHQPSGGGRGRASDIEITADEIQKLRDKANELIAKETGRSAEQVNKDTDRDYWMSAEEAKKYGLVSRIVRSAKEIG
jgi:ATP-dependent Clp protease protease subunit